MSYYTEQEQISVRSPILNRNHVETETLIGAFAIPLILSTKILPEQTFSNLLSEVRQGTLEAYSHPEMPLNYNLLSSVLFDFMKEPTDVITLPNLKLEVENKLASLTIGGVDLFSYLAEVKGQEGLYWALGYNTKIFSSETIKELMNSYLQILETCVTNSDQKISQFSLSKELVIAKNLNAQQIAIASTCTAEPLAESLSFWMKQLEISSNIKFAAFNQVFQELLEPQSLLAQNQNGINLILVRFQDWLSSNNIEQNLLANVQQLVTAIKSSSARTKVPHILVLCPNSLENSQKYQVLFEGLEEKIKVELANINGVYLLTSTDLQTTYPVENYEDHYAEQQASIPFTPAFYTALGTQISRKINVIKSNPYKVIVLDCDRTLWDGVCGEDSIKEIKIDGPYRFLQEFMVAQHNSGKLICLCSKNNPEDVEAVWQYHQMPLRDEYIIAKRINWQAKSENLKSLAKELNLDLNSFIFIDDNPVECAEVQANCPEVLTIQLPEEAENITRFLQHIWAFDWLKITEADQQRTESYRDNIKRESYRENTLTLADFIAGLELKVNISSLALEEVTRVSQLAQRTNQFNLTTIRYSPEEIQKIYESEQEQCLVVKVRDRFGDYGLVGAIIFEINDSILRVKNLMLSCRAFGKGVEHQMLAHLGKIALEAEINQINLPYIATSKNQPARNFLETIGSEFKQVTESNLHFNLPAEFASKIIYQPENNQTLTLDKTSNISNHKQSRNVAPFARIATELAEVKNILQAIQLQKHQARPDIKTNYVAPQTQTEQTLAKIVAKILNLESVGINDDFFELGGSSMLAVQFISEVNKVFKIELSLLNLFQATTIAKFAKVIDSKFQEQPINQNITIDWDAEAVLDPSIYPQTPFIKTIEQPKAILLTGATGFLGAFLLHDLIKETSANIYCLVRANNILEGQEKLRKNLEKYSLWHEELNHRIIALPGNLAQPYLGLSPEEFEQIASEIDWIYHNGAAVNFIYPYEQLKAANVKGTEEILRLASHTKDKPVHFVSTIGIFQTAENKNNLIKEIDNPSNPQAIQGGYFQSKWVAEKLVKNAFSRGMTGCIYRLGAVAGDSQTGIGNTDDAMARMLKGFTELRKAPKIDFPIDIVPVDYVSQGIVYLSQQEQSLGQTFHFCQQK
ncbi:MAG: thioester reductase domain-containing protein, partial [Cyanobacteria bacterium P01_F01_bin.143]